ncbi:MAG: ATP-dependent Clp protease adaptor ClpS [Gemmataceae bacterium]|jgi:ATP-dependent Clp protease adaptor protein ClpS
MRAISSSTPMAFPARGKTAPKNEVRRQPPYNVILLNDDDHTYRYVIEMLQKIFGFPPEKGFQIAEEVDRTGRVILLTTSKEHAELKQDQVHSYGPDPYLGRPCSGSMTCVIEPAV